jgi:porphobilinogen synthase
MRRLVRENRLSVDQLIYPLFIQAGSDIRDEISSMPGQFRISLDQLPSEIAEIVKLEIPAVLLFGLPENKDAMGTGAYAEDGIVQEATRVIKEIAPHLCIVTDVCLCEYTDHGHCGVIRNNYVDNDETLELLARTAVTQAKAGADLIAPSAMMDGQIAAIRQALDEAGHLETPIMSYAAKYSSAFYGPFREAADSAPQFGDRKSYQMDPPNVREALREMELDIAEGADILMVKPALAYLDVIRAGRDNFDLPMAAYNVSGEYSMVKAAAQNGWVDEEKIVQEILTGITRAGADILITYFAKDIAKMIQRS